LGPHWLDYPQHGKNWRLKRYRKGSKPLSLTTLSKALPFTNISTLTPEDSAENHVGHRSVTQNLNQNCKMSSTLQADSHSQDTRRNVSRFSLARTPKTQTAILKYINRAAIVGHIYTEGR
jgi:hypothetical protein